MKNIKKSKASLMVSALIILTLISTMLIILTTYASNNLKQTKIQEEGLHAYFLAYSGCELAYDALMKEANSLISGGIDKDKKWELLAQKFSASDATFLNKHTVCISYDGTMSEPGYANKSKFELTKVGSPSTGLSNLLSEFKDAVILVKVTKVPNAPSIEEEQQYKGYIRIESIAKTKMNSTFPGYAVKFLYIDPQKRGKFFWR